MSKSCGLFMKPMSQEVRSYNHILNGFKAGLTLKEMENELSSNEYSDNVRTVINHISEYIEGKKKLAFPLSTELIFLSPFSTLIDRVETYIESVTNGNTLVQEDKEDMFAPITFKTIPLNDDEINERKDLIIAHFYLITLTQ